MKPSNEHPNGTCISRAAGLQSAPQLKTPPKCKTAADFGPRSGSQGPLLAPSPLR